MGQLSRDTAKRIAEVTRYIELQPRNTVPQASSYRGAPGKRYAWTTSGITARTGTGPNFTLGKGTATLLFVEYDSAGVATTSATSYPDITVYSGALSVIASGKLIQVTLLDGAWHVDTDYCEA